MRFIVRVRNVLANLCDWLGEGFVEASRRLRACPKCGRSRFYGVPCEGDF